MDQRVQQSLQRWCGSVRHTASIAITFLLTSMSAQSVLGADPVKVDWSDPGIQNFVELQQSNPGAVSSLLFDPKLVKLQLPVLGFKEALPSTKSFGIGLRAKRSLVMDEKNPVWYELTYDYGKHVRVTVAADLRVQNELPSSTELTPPEGGFDPDGDISVFDETSEVGMTGAIAEFTVERFGGVSYTVTFECSQEKKELCRDVDTLKKDRKLLDIISARRPE